jgi:hypothetical protein
MPQVAGMLDLSAESINDLNDLNDLSVAADGKKISGKTDAVGSMQR